MHIARQYLEPQTRDDAGVPADAAEITDVAMAHLINEYARYVFLQGYEHLSVTVLLEFIEQECCWDCAESDFPFLLNATYQERFERRVQLMSF